jgi:hypothetical protein
MVVENRRHVPVFPAEFPSPAKGIGQMTRRSSACHDAVRAADDMDTLSRLRSGELVGSRRLGLSCGLREFPAEIYGLADSLEIFDWSNNLLTELPDDLVRLRKLKVIFCSGNPFLRLPEVLGECAELEMVGFKSCGIDSVPDAAIPERLKWLVLTDNRIDRLPESLGDCGRLQKLMLAGNRLEHLPDGMQACGNLELVRLSANRFRSFPEWLFRLPRLSWLALGGNPWHEAEIRDGLPEIDWQHLDLDVRLGEGASGVIHKARWRGFDDDSRSRSVAVAVKVSKGEMTSDGLPECEMAVCLSVGSHPNLVGVLGRTVNHPEGREGLVMPLIDPMFTILANPPDLTTFTRDVYAEERVFDQETVLRMARSLAAAAAHLHERGIRHGDLYGHNILWDGSGHCLLGYFGAASFYPPGSGLERVEVRADGGGGGELLDKMDGAGNGMEEIRGLQSSCVSEVTDERPSFTEICRRLYGMTSSATVL